ncbi:hypothetical protein DIPPA_28155 [Diplonema papillatum]|nr:hypothetical protein DIPPA_28155 [Diplonema papillatum]
MMLEKDVWLHSGDEGKGLTRLSEVALTRLETAYESLVATLRGDWKVDTEILQHVTDSVAALGVVMRQTEQAVREVVSNPQPDASHVARSQAKEFSSRAEEAFLLQFVAPVTPVAAGAPLFAFAHDPGSADFHHHHHHQQQQPQLPPRETPHTHQLKQRPSTAELPNASADTRAVIGRRQGSDTGCKGGPLVRGQPDKRSTPAAAATAAQAPDDAAAAAAAAAAVSAAAVEQQRRACPLGEEAPGAKAVFAEILGQALEATAHAIGAQRAVLYLAVSTGNGPDSDGCYNNNNTADNNNDTNDSGNHHNSANATAVPGTRMNIDTLIPVAVAEALPGSGLPAVKFPKRAGIPYAVWQGGVGLNACVGDSQRICMRELAASSVLCLPVRPTRHTAADSASGPRLSGAVLFVNKATPDGLPPSKTRPLATSNPKRDVDAALPLPSIPLFSGEDEGLASALCSLVHYVVNSRPAVVSDLVFSCVLTPALPRAFTRTKLNAASVPPFAGYLHDSSRKAVVKRYFIDPSGQHHPQITSPPRPACPQCQQPTTGALAPHHPLQYVSSDSSSRASTPTRDASPTPRGVPPKPAGKGQGPVRADAAGAPLGRVHPAAGRASPRVVLHKLGKPRGARAPGGRPNTAGAVPDKDGADPPAARAECPKPAGASAVKPGAAAPSPSLLRQSARRGHGPAAGDDADAAPDSGFRTPHNLSAPLPGNPSEAGGGAAAEGRRHAVPRDCFEIPLAQLVLEVSVEERCVKEGWRDRTERLAEGLNEIAALKAEVSRLRGELLDEQRKKEVASRRVVDDKAETDAYAKQVKRMVELLAARKTDGGQNPAKGAGASAGVASQVQRLMMAAAADGNGSLRGAAKAAPPQQPHEKSARAQNRGAFAAAAGRAAGGAGGSGAPPASHNPDAVPEQSVPQQQEQQQQQQKPQEQPQPPRHPSDAQRKQQPRTMPLLLLAGRAQAQPASPVSPGLPRAATDRTPLPTANSTTTSQRKRKDGAPRKPMPSEPLARSRRSCRSFSAISVATSASVEEEERFADQWPASPPGTADLPSSTHLKKPPLKVLSRLSTQLHRVLERSWSHNTSQARLSFTSVSTDAHTLPFKTHLSVANPDANAIRRPSSARTPGTASFGRDRGELDTASGRGKTGGGHPPEKSGACSAASHQTEADLGSTSGAVFGRDRKGGIPHEQSITITPTGSTVQETSVDGSKATQPQASFGAEAASTSQETGGGSIKPDTKDRSDGLSQKQPEPELISATHDPCPTDWPDAVVQDIPPVMPGAMDIPAHLSTTPVPLSNASDTTTHSTIQGQPASSSQQRWRKPRPSSAQRTQPALSQPIPQRSSVDDSAAIRVPFPPTLQPSAVDLTQALPPDARSAAAGHRVIRSKPA